MADLDFEDDLRGMFAVAAPAPDAAAFAARVEQGLDRIRWIRLAVVAVLGLLGGLIAWALFGASIADLSTALGAMAAATAGGAGADDASGWAALLLVVAVGGLVVRPVFSES